ncbi:DUF433 domain-containing protein [Phormidium tenue FACHB-1052]|uniref:Antitoxin n=2 Tax=Phormidium tenue TaxID=126344 RepID=A0A1U7J2I2_9CYAN|nr:DUF433 domain-containing protein [Phormidium tenue]MBD2233742.1 DUF433 domain-containing protein [Phormidium tenue FACHB-1052]OKH46213.1 hypothetical protein NIES30_17845 [Phormidium tenue NIES-30]
MNERTLLERITVDPTLFGGRPVIRGRTITVERVLVTMVEGASLEGVLEIYPELTRDDILACLEYARRLIAVMRLKGTDLLSK